jgi:hypothetical protein
MRSLSSLLGRGNGSQCELAGPRERQAGKRHLEIESQAATSLVCVDIGARLRQPYSKG